LDTADTLTRLNTDLNVTLLTPAGTPGVLNKVVFGTVGGSVTNSHNSVVKASSARRSRQDTTGVTLENSFVGLNGDSNWLLVKGGLKLGGRVVRYLREGFSVDFTFAGACLARSIFTGVFVVRLELNSVGLSVIEGIILPTTVATLVSVRSGAVNKLLLRK